MKKLVLGLGFSLLATLGFGQVQSGAFRLLLDGLLQHSVPEISVAEASRDSARLCFLDAREPNEYAVSRLAGARWVGYDQFDLARVAQLDRSRTVVVYCSVGYRSEKIAEKLRAAGFTDVRNLYGGIFEWVNQGHPVYDDRGKTLNVHAYNRTWGVWLKKGKKVY
jgi:rhodanese-related sulfurtransferase